MRARPDRPTDGCCAYGCGFSHKRVVLALAGTRVTHAVERPVPGSRLGPGVSVSGALLLSYGQSKSASALFAVGVDAVGRRDGVRAFAVHPGGVLTDLSQLLASER
jgi:NAD(P)-dependent dehydrogenase (short-subunit alcohol dehydrogenase family)